MKNKINHIKKIIDSIDSKAHHRKIYTHSLLEFQNIDNILKHYSNKKEDVFIINENLKPTIELYIKKLSKIKKYYFEIYPPELNKEFPDVLKPPVILEGDVLKLKKEIKVDFYSKEKSEILHITFTNCKSKHITIDSRGIILFTP